MKEVKYLISILVLIIIITNVSAGNYCSTDLTLGKVSQGDCIQLVQTYSNSTYSNLTKIQLSDKSITYYNLEFEKHDSDYNLTYCNTTILGEQEATICTDVDGVKTCVIYNFCVTPKADEFTTPIISVYIFFLLLCIVLITLSGILIRNNSIQKDEIKDYDMYELKKRNEFHYYLKLLKQKMWILGVFGVYLSLLLFIAISSNLVFNLGLRDLFNIMSSILEVMLWGLIPFICFWIGYIIIHFYKSAEKIFKYQFGTWGEN